MSEPVPPRAPTREHSIVVHGEVRSDPWAWLRDKSDPAVIAYLEAENAYTKEMLAHTEPLQALLYREMLARIKETDFSVPYRYGPFFYYTRTVEALQYGIHCRRRALEREQGPEEVILDENALAKGHEYFDLGLIEPDPAHRVLAYAVDVKGDERFTLCFKDLESGRDLPERIAGAGTSCAWAEDGATAFYSVLDDTQRPFRIMRHALGSDPQADVCVFEDLDERYFVHVDRTRSNRYLLIESASKVTTEVWYLRTDDPNGAFRCVRPREEKHEYSLEHHGDRFFVLSNEGATNFKLLEAPESDPSPANWRLRIPHRDDVMLSGVDAFARHLVIHERQHGLPHLRVCDLETGADHRIAFPEPAYTVGLATNVEFETSRLRFVYTSMVTPRSVFEYDMATGARELLKMQEIPCGYDSAQYASERIEAASPDGTRVPISLVYRRGFARDGSAPLLLVGYGAYGLNYDPQFSSDRLSLLDRGFVVAIAHVRGGGEMGRRWYDHGKFLEKKNTFADFIACAQHLLDQRYTARDRLIVTGGSAGGMLMGVALNERPDLFFACVAQVPFVDCLNSMLDDTLPLTVAEYEEWGDPNDRRFYDYLKSYSPVDNVRAQAYPHLLITAGLNDPRVGFWEPAKWCAKLRATKTDGRVLLLKVNMGAGHQGASGRYDFLKEKALEYAFMLDRVGRGSPGALDAVPPGP